MPQVRPRRATSFVRSLCLPALFPFVALSDAAAQPAVSEELNALLLRQLTGAGAGAYTVVGRMPPELRETLALPSSVRFLASVSDGEEVTIFATSASRSAAAEIEQAMTARGWTVPRRGERAGGLRPAAIAQPVMLCRGESGLIVQPSASPSGVDLVIRRVSASSGCTAPDRRSPGMERPELPLLTAPMTSTERQRACMRGREFGSHMSSTVPIPAELSAEELLEQYEQQMLAQGWRRAERVAASTWERDAGDERKLATLLVVPAAGGCYSVSLSLHR